MKKKYDASILLHPDKKVRIGERRFPRPRFRHTYIRGWYVLNGRVEQQGEFVQIDWPPAEMQRYHLTSFVHWVAYRLLHRMFNHLVIIRFRAVQQISASIIDNVTINDPKEDGPAIGIAIFGHGRKIYLREREEI